jgi:predicted ATPase/lipopolysaccharide biosynthesis regulator YciM
VADSLTELKRARSVQAAMLPDAPVVAGLEIAAGYRACEHVGGDFYDFVVVDPWHLGFVMADVSGHGTAAALVMAAAKKTLQLCGRGCLSPREALLAANENLAREIPRGMFVSVFYGVLDVRGLEFTFCRAGHNPLVLLRDGAIEAHAPAGSVLGVMASAALGERLEEQTLALREGDAVVIYTDGLTEAMNPRREMWTEARMHAALAGMATTTAPDVVSRLLQRMDEFREGAAQNDDQALVVLRPVKREGDAQPLQAAGGAPETNLPPHATSLIGRENEVAELLGLLTDADTGVVTVTGTAGIGKTRVALGGASLALAAFPAGVWFAELGEVEDAEGVCKQVGAALGVDLSRGDAGERVGLALQGRTRTRAGRLLLVLDNIDQCRRAVAELVGQWRALTRDIVVLATSRTALGIGGERGFPLRPLSVPVRKKTERIEIVDEPALRALARMPSVELFVARAKDRDPGFELTRENADAVGQLCVRLDGVPLAIELAAARARVLSPQKMVERLNQRFALLRDQRGSSRQSTLRGAIEWSWELLDTTEREALAQLSVLRGGFFLEVAEQVVDLLHLPDAPPLMDLVEGLHDKSLLDSVEIPRLSGERRFNMFESIRAFALEQLNALGRAPEVEARWRAALAGYARKWNAKSHADESRLRLQLELDALSEIARGSDEHACWAGLVAGPMLQRLGSPRAARDILRRLADIAPVSELQSRLQIAYALALVHADPAAAEQVLSKVSPDSPMYIEAVLALGQTYQNRGNGKVMIELLNGLAKRPDLSPLHRARISAGLGSANLMTGNVNRGLEYYFAALKAAEGLGDTVLQGQVTGNIGVVCNMKGDHAKALEYFNRALGLLQTREHQIAETYWLVNIGGIHNTLGEYDEAEAKLSRALKIGQENGLREVTAAALGALAMTAAKRDDYTRAYELANQALEIDREIGNVRGQAAHLTQLLQIKRQQGKLDEFEQGMHEVIALAEKVGDSVMVAERVADLGVAECERGLKNGDAGLLRQAAGRLENAIRGLEQLGAGRAFDGRAAWARALHQLGEDEAAKLVIVRLLELDPQTPEERLEQQAARKLMEKLDGNRTAD